MSVLENSTFCEILKETVILLTHIGDLSLKILCYTPLSRPKYKKLLRAPFITLQLAYISS
jgi:hypothetical protein